MHENPYHSPEFHVEAPAKRFREPSFLTQTAVIALFLVAGLIGSLSTFLLTGLKDKFARNADEELVVNLLAGGGWVVAVALTSLGLSVLWFCSRAFPADS
jgi:hypothetical protein